MSFQALPALRAATGVLLGALLPLLFASPASANSNRKGDWRTHETPHFRVVYHEEVAAQAAFAREFLEVAYEAQTRALGLRSFRIPITVVLTGHIDESNGYATPLGHRIVIWTRPGQVIASNDMAWLRRVLAHELAHQLTFLGLRNFFGIYGEVYKSANLPAWFMEGLAQYLGEDWDAKRNTFFAHALANSALEPYPCMASYLEADPVSGRLVYEQGHALVRFLADRHGGAPFLGRLLRRVTVIPLWNEFKGLMSPLTSRYLPLESALLSLTKRSMASHYAEFLDSLRAGLPDSASRAGPRPEALVPGLEGFAAVFQARETAPGEYIVAAQEDWDRPFTTLHRLRQGRAEPLGTGFANPVFDVSPDGRLLAYVREYADRDGEPSNRLKVRDLATGKERDLGKGAYHPAFLSPDTVALSRWKDGRQVLDLCALAAGPPRCVALAPDSLTGYFALSRSSRGLLLNATDASGRTGIWEWSRGDGFQRILQDTVLAEFPVEDSAGRIWMIREIGGLMQAAVLDRADGIPRPAPLHASGTFYLHRVAPGRIASVAQARGKHGWHLAPVEVAAPADTTGPAIADTTPSASAPPAATAFQAPHFLREPPLLPRSPIPATSVPAPAPADPPQGRPYLSPLAVRPQLLWPYVGLAYSGGALGAGGLFSDPLDLHTVQGSVGLVSDEGPRYNVLYINAQPPAELSLYTDNADFRYDSVEASVAGYTLVETVVRTRMVDGSVGLRPPWDLPSPHGIFLSLGLGGEFHEDRVAGRTGEKGRPELLDWSRTRRTWHHREALGWFYSQPYAYAAAHPLRETGLSVSHLRRYPGGEDYLQGQAVHVFPLFAEVTLTGAWRGDFSRLDSRRLEFPLPDGSSVVYSRKAWSGWSQYAYGAVDVPLWKGYLIELPLLGVCNYAGLGAFGAYDQSDADSDPLSSGNGGGDASAVAGTRLHFLFHILRKIPVVWSWYAQWDIAEEEPEFRFSLEFGSIPSQVTGRLAPDRAASVKALRQGLRLPLSDLPR